MLGSGTELDPYQVATASDLNNVRNDLNAYYLQVTNIDLSEYANWIPIGIIENEKFEFSGNYNGNNFIISNLNINYDGSNVGLFSESLNASFQNIKIINTNVISGSWYVGTLCGISTNTILKNCHVQGNVISSNGNAGGLIGSLYNSLEFSESVEYDVFNCSADCTLSTKPTKIPYVLGGLFGECIAKSIVQSYSVCNFPINTHDSSSIIGGLIGEFAYISPQTILSKCYSIFNIDSVSIDNTGGLIGYMSKSYGAPISTLCLIENCYTKGSLFIDEEEYSYATGGFIGAIRHNSVKIKNCYSNYEINVSDINLLDEDNNAFIGEVWNEGIIVEDCYFDSKCNLPDNYAISKTTAEMKTQSTFIDWDFINIWKISPSQNNGYPYFGKGKFLINCKSVVPSFIQLSRGSVSSS